MCIGNGIKISVNGDEERYVRGIRRPVSKRYNRRLKMDFLFNNAYHQRENPNPLPEFKDCLDPEGKTDDACDKCKHLDTCFYAFSDTFDDSNYPYYNGAYPICYAGCTYTYFLIITGEKRGEVWIDNELTDFVPVKQDFVSFLKWVSTADSY